MFDLTLVCPQIFSLLPFKRNVPYETEDPQECLPVRPRRYILPIPEGKDDPFRVFQVVCGSGRLVTVGGEACW